MYVDYFHVSHNKSLKVTRHGSKVSIVLPEVEVDFRRHLGVSKTFLSQSILYYFKSFLHCDSIFFTSSSVSTRVLKTKLFKRPISSAVYRIWVFLSSVSFSFYQQHLLLNSNSLTSVSHLQPSLDNAGLFNIVVEFGCKTELQATGQIPCIRGKSCDKILLLQLT